MPLGRWSIPGSTCKDLKDRKGFQNALQSTFLPLWNEALNSLMSVLMEYLIYHFRKFKFKSVIIVINIFTPKVVVFRNVDAILGLSSYIVFASPKVRRIKHVLHGLTIKCCKLALLRHCCIDEYLKEH